MAPRFSGALQPLFPLLFQPLRRTLAILFGPLLLRAGRVRVEGPSKHRCSAEAPYQRRVRAHSFLSIGVIRAIRGCRCRMPQASFRCLPGSFDFSIPPTDSRLSRAGVTLIAPCNPRSFIHAHEFSRLSTKWKSSREICPVPQVRPSFGLTWARNREHACLRQIADGWRTPQRCTPRPPLINPFAERLPTFFGPRPLRAGRARVEGTADGCRGPDGGSYLPDVGTSGPYLPDVGKCGALRLEPCGTGCVPRCRVPR